MQDTHPSGSPPPANNQAPPPPLKRPGPLKQALFILLVVLIALSLAFGYYWLFLIPEAEDAPDWAIWNQDITCSEWACDITQVDEMNAFGYHGEGIVIGIVDSGIDTGHPDILEDSVLHWKDLVNERSEPYDDEGHGTAMAGIMIANGDLKGIAREAKLIVVKAIDADGLGDPANVVAGIEFCMDPNGDGDLSDGADIISLSLGGAGSKRFWDTDEVSQAARYAAENGIFVIASAGNDGLSDDGDVESPATEELVIAVGAIDSSLSIADFSSIGDNDGRTPMARDDRFDPNKKPEIVAPGVGIATTYLNNGYVDVDGTSPAAAFVSAGLALLLEAHPDYMIDSGPEKVLAFKAILMETSEKMPGQDIPHDNYYGYGLIKLLDTSEAM
ncbi:MAG: S8 family serine peptidase [Thermoplasmata archaeon]|nr:S8 family serine peptidase [Thermoplasmata archaeon]